MIRWQWSSGGKFTMREWAGESVIYNLKSGSTHLLGEIATELFFSLEGRSASAIELAQTVAEVGQLPFNDELAEKVSSILFDLRDLELVESIEL